MEGINLTVDLGHLSPNTDVAISSPENITPNTHLSIAQSKIGNDNIGPCWSMTRKMPN